MSSGHTVHPTWVPILTNQVCLTVLGGLCRAPLLTAGELSDRTHFSDRPVRRHMELLIQAGVVHECPGERDGLTPGRPASRYAVDPAAAERVAALFELISMPLPTAPR